jgi:nucleoid-associated protein YgaU
MADERLNALKLKYKPVFDEIEGRQVRLQNVHIEGGKLLIRGVAPSDEAKNRVWDKIKAVDPSYSDLTAEITVAAAAQAAQARAAGATAAEPVVYTVQPGDTLSKIAKNYYGDANQYTRIFEANRDKLENPNVIRPGQRLLIPQ